MFLKVSKILLLSKLFFSIFFLKDTSSTDWFSYWTYISVNLLFYFEFVILCNIVCLYCFLSGLVISSIVNCHCFRLCLTYSAKIIFLLHISFFIFPIYYYFILYVSAALPVFLFNFPRPDSL